METQSTQTPNPTSPEQNQFNASGQEKKTGMAIIAYIIFFIPLLTDAKNDVFVKYHVRQSLGLLLAWFVWSVIDANLNLFGLGIIVSLAFLVLWVLGIINAATGKQEPLPLVGQYFEKLKF